MLNDTKETWLYIRRVYGQLKAFVSPENPPPEWVAGEDLPERLADKLVGRVIGSEEVITFKLERSHIEPLTPRFKVRQFKNLLAVRNARTDVAVNSWVGTPLKNKCEWCGTWVNDEWSFSEVDRRAAEELCAQLNKTYYKVMRTAVTWMRSLAGGKDYRVGERTNPVPGTGLLAFRTLEQAVDFRGTLDPKDYLIVSGYGPPGPALPNSAMDLSCGWCGQPKSIEEHWRNNRYGPVIWPDGTVSLGWFVPEKVVA